MPATREDMLEFAQSLGIELPPLEEFWKLGDKTALRQDKETGRFYRSNYERGPLLYALVAKYRPQRVLEFGTGRGYGTLCMAWAMEDHGIDGSIYSVDFLSPDSPIPWTIDRHDGTGPQNETLSWNQVWPDIAPESWRKRIHHLTGYSDDVMSVYTGPKFDFAFIDGGHGYEAVRHDFYATLQHLGDTFGILFDDYAVKQGFGVNILIDEEVSPHFDAYILPTHRENPLTGEREQSIYSMVWIHTESLSKPLADIYDSAKMQKTIDHYRKTRDQVSLKKRVGDFLRKLGLR